MLQSQPAFQPFAAGAQFGNDRTDDLRTKRAFAADVLTAALTNFTQQTALILSEGKSISQNGLRMRTVRLRHETIVRVFAHHQLCLHLAKLYLSASAFVGSVPKSV